MPFLFVALVESKAKRRGPKLTGGQFVTDRGGRHLYVRGGMVVAGRGLQAGVGIGAKPKPIPPGSVGTVGMGSGVGLARKPTVGLGKPGRKSIPFRFVSTINSSPGADLGD